MSKFPTALSLFLALLPSLLAAPQGDADLRKVGASVQAYFDARGKALDVDGARDAAVKALGSIANWDPLKKSADLGRALELARSVEGADGREGKVNSETIKDGAFLATGLEIAYRLPKNYDPTKRHPLVLAIPDVGEKPAEHIRANWTFAALRDAAIVVTPAMPADNADWTRVTIKGKPGGLCHALTALRIACERFAVDVDRIYVAGRGKGVPAALACGNYSPQRFAGIIGRSGDAAELAPDNFIDLPTFFAGAGARATAFQEAAVKLGIDHCKIGAAATEEDVWTWMIANPRRKLPEQVNVVPGDPFPTRAYWMRVAPSASDARATAKLERGVNAVIVQAKGVSGVTLYLSDAMLDLDKPVRVVCNDVETVVNVERSLANTLEMLYDGTSDTSVVYTARADVDLARPNDAAPAEVPASKDAEFTSRLTAANHDPAKLWELYLWCQSNKRASQAQLALRAIVRVSPDHAQAREALGYVRSGALWFASREAADRYEREQDPAAAEARGWVKQRGAWMHPDDRSRLDKGATKDFESGLWLGARDRERLAKGWARQDLQWIEPSDVDHVDLGQWRVDGEWLELAAADRRHASIDDPWIVPTREILLYTTTSRAVGLRAIPHMERAIDDLRRVFGIDPPMPLCVALMHDEEQYDRFAFGDPDGRRRATHAGRLHTLHYGFFAESWFPPSEGKREFRGMGVGYWDAFLPNGDAYGVHSARLACGLSYVDAIDPSPKAVRNANASGAKSDYYAAYQTEKRLPAWLRDGGAVYAERFFRDPTVAADGDPWWARKWSLDNLRGLGELDTLSNVFAFKLDPDERDKSRKLMLEAGLMVSFLVDGECAPVTAAHADFKRLLASGEIHPKTIAALEAALTAAEPELRKFAGL